MKLQALFAALTALPVLATATCTDYYIPVNVTGVQNRLVLALGDDLSTVSGVESFLSSLVGGLGQALGGLLPTSGSYNIAASYCPGHTIKNATLQAQRASEVQLLVHGAPYSKVSKSRPPVDLDIALRKKNCYRPTGLD